MLKYLALLLFAASAVAQPFPARPGPVIISQPGTGGSSSPGGGLDTNAVIALIEEYGGGGSGLVSNAVNLTFTATTPYTNDTDYYLTINVSAENRGATANGSSFASIDVDIQPDGAFDYTRIFSLSSSATFTNRVMLIHTIEPRQSWRVSTSGGAVIVSAGGQLLYFSTNSAGGGGSVSTAEVVAIMETNNAATVTSDPIKTFNVVSYGADPTGVADSTGGIFLANDNLGYLEEPGRLVFPDGTYALTNTILIEGYIPPAVGLYGVGGFVEVLGSGYSRLSYSGNSNAIQVIAAQTFSGVKKLTIVGTNNVRSAAGHTVGILLDGPSGGVKINDVNVQRFWAGIYLHDITGGYVHNAYVASNFVGMATGYKPDGVVLHGRFERNIYGMWIGFTNGLQDSWSISTYSDWTDAGSPTISGVFGYNTVGVMVSRGAATIENCYFEGNGTSIQIGCNTGNAFEATYGASAGTDPQVSIKNFDANTANDVRIYQQALVTSINGKWEASTSKIRLMNADADLSTIDSDTPVTVVNSSAAEFSVNNNYRYVAGRLLPRSGMSWTNLTDRPSYIDPMDTTYVVIREDFAGGTATSGSVGNLGWAFAGTVADLANPAADWDGKIKATTGASSNAYAAVWLNSTIVNPTSGTNWVAKFRFKLPQTNDVMGIVGIQSYSGYEINYDAGAATARRSAGAFLIYTQGMVNFRLETRISGGAITTTEASTVAVNTNWNTLFLAATNGNIFAGVNGETPIALGAAVGSTAHYYTPYFAVSSGAAAAKAIWIDYFGFIQPRKED